MKIYQLTRDERVIGLFKERENAVKFYNQVVCKHSEFRINEIETDFDIRNEFLEITKPTLTPAEAAKVLYCSRSQIYKLITQKEIRAIKYGDKIVLYKRDVLEYRKSHIQKTENCTFRGK